MRGKALDLLALGDGRAALHARQDDRLADVRQGIFCLERRRCAAERRNARADLVCKPQSVERVHLLAMRAVNAGVSGVQAHDRLSRTRRRRHDRDDLLERHFRAVVDRTVLFCVVQQRRIDERTGVNDDIRLAEQLRAAHSDEVGRARAGADKVDHLRSSFTRMMEK